MYQLKTQFNLLKPLAALVSLAGLLVLIWGLNSLHTIFSQERSDATETILSRHQTLEQYAIQALQQSLQQQLAFAKVNLNHILRDPLIHNSDILYFENQIQILPRPSLYRSDNQSPQTTAISLYHELMARDPIDLVNETQKPWERMLDGLSRFKLAVESNDATNIRWEFREVSDRRSNKPVSGEKDIPYMMALLDYLLAFSSPDRTLVSNIIRTGSLIDQEYGHYGLQRSLIANRHLFTKEEFEFLKSRIVSVSNKYSIPFEDFLTQSNVEDQLLNFKIETQYPALLRSGDPHKQWYTEPQNQSEVLGVRVDSLAMVAQIDATMKDIGLLEPGDALNFPVTQQQKLLLNDIMVSVHSISLQDKLDAASKRYWLKSLLLFTIALLVSSIAILVILIVYRKQRYLALKSDFIATVSHELKTPLASVRVMAETLLRKTQAFNPARDYPSRIISSIDSMALLVDNILSFNRLTKDSWNLKKFSFNVEEVIASLIHEFKQYTNTPLNIDITNPDNVEIDADQELIKILFRNLVNNACKYNQNSNIDVTISIRQSECFDVIIDFSDNGSGIKKENHTAVFDEFSRFVNYNKTVSGTGLGLAICKKIMLLHGGDIKVSESDSRGTTFKMKFPGHKSKKS